MQDALRPYRFLEHGGEAEVELVAPTAIGVFEAGLAALCELLETGDAGASVTFDVDLAARAVLFGAVGTVIMTSDKSCTAGFDLVTYTLAIAKGGPGTGTVTGAGTYSSGQTAIVSAIIVSLFGGSLVRPNSPSATATSACLKRSGNSRPRFSARRRIP